MKIFTRKRWNARPPREMAEQSSHHEFFVHYSASPGKGIDTLAEQSETMRQLQALHMSPPRGWSDIAYYYVIFQPYGRLRRARVFEGRNKRYVPAAQLGHNVGTFPVCVVMRQGEALKRSTKAILKQLYHDSPCHVARGHFEVTPTDCPGPALKAFLPELRRVK